jgi:tubulin polyglutamylase complex subunit 2
MPEDMKNFYLMTNGFHMTWSVKLDGESASVLSGNISLEEKLGAITSWALTTFESLNKNSFCG